MKKKLVLFNGLSFFGNKLVREIQSIDSINKYKFLETYTRILHQFLFLFYLRQANLVVSFNGVTTPSGALDKVLNKKIPMVMYWHGTDVLLAKQRYESGTINKKYAEWAKHFTDAKWLQEELQEIGIEAELLPFKHVDSFADVLTYEKISVLTYLAQGKEKFYGLNDILSLAEKFPEIKFTVAGSDGKGITHPSNVLFFGWCKEDEMMRLRTKHAIFIRLTEHDGNSLSVLEALASGQEVIWNYPGENCNYVHDLDSTISTLNDLIQKIENRGMQSSLQNINFVKSTYSKEKILINFKNSILRFAG